MLGSDQPAQSTQAYLSWWAKPYSQITDLFDIVNSRFERDRDHTRLQGQGLDWFSRSAVRLCMHREPAGNFTTWTISRILTNFFFLWWILVKICIELKYIYASIAFDASVTDYFESKSIYCLISLSNITNNKEASRSANSPELKLAFGTAGNESVILPYRIRE